MAAAARLSLRPDDAIPAADPQEAEHAGGSTDDAEKQPQGTGRRRLTAGWWKGNRREGAARWVHRRRHRGRRSRRRCGRRGCSGWRRGGRAGVHVGASDILEVGRLQRVSRAAREKQAVEADAAGDESAQVHDRLVEIARGYPVIARRSKPRAVLVYDAATVRAVGRRWIANRHVPRRRLDVVGRVRPKEAIALGAAAEARRRRERTPVPGEDLQQRARAAADEGKRDEQVPRRAVEIEIESRAAVTDDIVEPSGRHLAELEPPERVAFVVASVTA